LGLPLVVGLLIAYGWASLVAQRSAWAEKPKPAPVKAVVKAKTLKRVGSVVGLNRKTVEEYVILHKYVWPQVLERLQKSNVRNYTIYLTGLDDGNLYLFSHFEYTGDDFEADMKAIADDPVTQEWWKLTDPLQKRVRDTPKGDQWKRMEEVFHMD
jgi:L-rhamnose mutarotase